jgi:hypothetical protein
VDEDAIAPFHPSLAQSRDQLADDRAGLSV